MAQHTTLEHKAWGAIKEYSMLHRGDSIVVGVSGGADSVALFDFLCSQKQRMKLTIKACHINHNLRGEESKRDEDFVRQLCLLHDVEFCLLSADVALEAKRLGKGIEETARELRYAFFEECAGDQAKIATAHTLNDSVETFLFRLARGSGARGLRGIPPVRNNIIRPLIGCTRQDVEEHLKAKGIMWMTDSTNLTDVYARNRIRHQVLPELEAINFRALEAIAGAIQRIGNQQQLTEQLAQEAKARAVTRQGIDAQMVLSLPLAVGDELLLEFLEENNITAHSRTIYSMRSVLQYGGKVSLGQKKEFNVFGGVGTIQNIVAETEVFDKVLLIERSCLPQTILTQTGKNVKLAILPVYMLKNQEKINKWDLNYFADYDKISSTAVLRQKQDGDRIALGTRGSRLLKKLYQEAGIPPQDRKSLLVLADDQGVIWAEGFGFDRRVQSENVKDLFIIEVLEESNHGTPHA